MKDGSVFSLLPTTSHGWAAPRQPPARYAPGQELEHGAVAGTKHGHHRLAAGGVGIPCGRRERSGCEAAGARWGRKNRAGGSKTGLGAAKPALRQVKLGEKGLGSS